MKGFSSLIVVVCLFVQAAVQAQYKAPGQYLPKDFPAPRSGAQQPPPGQPPPPKAPDKQAPPVPQVPRFKDLATNTQFYFLSDTNRAFAWTKISASTATNTKNGATAAIHGETPIQR